jgi:hypothetical protein
MLRNTFDILASYIIDDETSCVSIFKNWSLLNARFRTLIFLKKCSVKDLLGTFAGNLFIIHLIINITSSREEGEGQEQEQWNAHVHPTPRTVFISVFSTHGGDVVQYT